MPKHSLEHTLFNNFRELDDTTKYVKLFNEHSKDQTFKTYRKMDKFIDVEYDKLSTEKQKEFLSVMSIAFTDLFTDGFGVPETNHL